MKSLITILALSFLFLTSSVFVSFHALEPKDFYKDISKTVVVSHKGKADFKTIQAAIDSIPSGNKKWIKIYLKHGTYNEKIVIPKEKPMIVMQGNNASKVVIQYNDAGLSNSSGPFRVNAEYFVAIDITFKISVSLSIPEYIEKYDYLAIGECIEDDEVTLAGIATEFFLLRDPSPSPGIAGSIEISAGGTKKIENINCSKNTPIIPYKEIKVAPSIILTADKAWFYGCNFISVQDTLADLLGRHYFENCYIEGAIDFIWGGGQSIYQNCVIHVKAVASKALLAGYITAQGRESEQDTSGFVFNNCEIKGDGMAYLGRAYRNHSRVVFYGTNMSNVIVPQGWDAWDYKGQEYKFTYVEVNCIGEGANKKKRVRWEKHPSAKDIDFLIEPKSFIDKDGWMAFLPSSLLSLYSPSSIF